MAKHVRQGVEIGDIDPSCISTELSEGVSRLAIGLCSEAQVAQFFELLSFQASNLTVHNYYPLFCK
jgi:hypothetical protein